MPISTTRTFRSASFRIAALTLFSFRMIGDTRIECRHANSQRKTTRIGPTGSHRGGTEPGRSGAIGLDGFLWPRSQRGAHLPSLWHQPPNLLSLAAPL